MTCRVYHRTLSKSYENALHPENKSFLVNKTSRAMECQNANSTKYFIEVILMLHTVVFHDFCQIKRFHQQRTTKKSS